MDSNSPLQRIAGGEIALPWAAHAQQSHCAPRQLSRSGLALDGRPRNRVEGPNGRPSSGRQTTAPASVGTHHTTPCAKGGVCERVDLRQRHTRHKSERMHAPINKGVEVGWGSKKGEEQLLACEHSEERVKAGGGHTALPSQ